ncbi:hypothetical protein ASPWEDRAFT_107169 [Aspergillus wentii DTO 134E9]|uniref:Uncharacterized protein n=1 Tax=Aspergillus wentii DTO 134E9 TaxID=1073089 RepID=A0A1L9RQZ6_ASPWE|nr:uncharacterized protein ASPWEDRAFT_107169 [Aspergillus wentii DTO 134E9]KAI9928155.1 hypothetical protein MW887_002188 [Aspergillus wentii]OJJ37365.1 hypothetical protein ASPWEDRAFT_107169 [Aspergillus wentii DTO 134E9]
MGHPGHIGNSAFYAAGDQRNPPKTETQHRAPYEEGQKHSHQNIDSKDDRSIANRLAAQSRSDEPSTASGSHYDPEAELSKKNPTAPAVHHGHEPSKGAKIDRELQMEDEQRLHEKGIK